MKRKTALASYVLPILFLFISTISFPQNSPPATSQIFKVTGKVTDDTGKPVSGATVAVKGSTIATATTTDGLFELNIPSGNSVLVITSVGFAGQEIAVNNRHEVNISMVNLAASLSDVVVVGYGTQKKRNVTGAVATFNASNLDERPVLRVDQALVGQLAGVTVKQTSGGLGKGFQVQVEVPDLFLLAMSLYM